MLPSIALLLALGLANPFGLVDDPQADSALKPLYLRIEVMTDELKTLPCSIEASDPVGGRYDHALLDLDGDGRFEKKVEFEKGNFYGSAPRFGFSMPIELGDMTFDIEMGGNQDDPVQGPVHLMWTLRKEKVYLFFINGQVKLYATAEEAAEGKALRLGPPFRFDLSSSTRGPEALVNVGLKDANGSTLRSATYGSKDPAAGSQSLIRLTFLKDGRERSAVDAQYG